MDGCGGIKLRNPSQIEVEVIDFVEKAAVVTTYVK